MQTHHAPAKLLAMLGLDTHFHKCARTGCGHIWSHRKADITSSREHDIAHSCPRCGTAQTEKCEPDGSPLKVSFKLNERELATTLAALASRQAALDDERDDNDEIATQQGRFVALTANEIEHLGDRLVSGDC
jgi:hypothetical protein